MLSSLGRSMSGAPEDRVYEVLEHTRQATKASPEELFSQIYGELRQVAHAYMRRERADHTLQATALVHEAYLRLFEGGEFRWDNREHLFCTLARTMRRILVDHSRRHRAERHGGGMQKVDLETQGPGLFRDPVNVLVVEKALERLAKLNPRQVQVVELHWYAGFTEAEVAEVLGLSLKTIKNDWRFAKAWIKTEIGEQDEDDPGTPRPDSTAV